MNIERPFGIAAKSGILFNKNTFLNPNPSTYEFKLERLLVVQVAYFLLVSSAQAAASLLPFGISTKIHITSVANIQMENKNANPIQLLPVLSIRAVRIMGAIVDDAVIETPRSPIN